MQRPSISIIVPVYNTDKYLCKCLDSILAQTYTNWEAILVDDGSTDKSGKICDDYAAKDKRFNVIHQNNGGVSVARQTGLDNATGDYIIHCDPDDWIEPTMLEELTQKAVKEDADMVICDIITHRNGIIEYSHIDLVTPTTAKEVQLQIIRQKLHGSCCNKLIRSRFCKKAGFKPSDIIYCEDELYNIRILNNDLKISYIPRALYNYRNDNIGSICNTLSAKSIQSKIKVIDEICKIIQVHKNSKELKAMKKSCIATAFTSREYHIISTLYVECHEEIINEGKKYNWYLPCRSCLSIALRGHTRFAYNLYKFNFWLIHTFKKIIN